MARVLLYDGDCGFCTSAARWLKRLGCTLEPVPYQFWPHLEEHGISPEQASGSLHVVDGPRVYVAHEAVAHALESSAAPLHPIGRLVRSRPVAPIAAAAYHWVTEHRDRLPGGTPACALPAEERP
jgi:predicted DCC family thiol-disulfide oxidoreductase YuxK